MIAAKPPLGICSKNLTSYYTDTRSTIFIAAVLKIARKWKQPKSSSTDEWTMKMWFICTMEFHSTAKKSKNMTFASKWIELDNIVWGNLEKHNLLPPICGSYL